ncbi:MAG: 4Fe-4S binding protein [Bryobacteraceae bacterium]
MATLAAQPGTGSRPKRTITRRRNPLRPHRIRRGVQLAFLALNVWIGIEFYRFVRFYESGGQTAWAARPPGIEGWLPIASLMNLKFWADTGALPTMQPAGMFLLIAFVLSSLLLRKAFCGWLCPVGTVSEYLWRLGRSTFGRNWDLPKWADWPLRSLKYILMALFLYAVGAMSAAAIAFFLRGPYGLIADVKMLNFFRFMGVTTAVTLGVLMLLSIFVRNFWCRYLCPYGALMGLFSWASPLRIRRNTETCIDCAKCAKACPSQLKVDVLVQVRSPECLGCYECVTACPVEDALAMSTPALAGRPRPVPAWALAACLGLIFFGFTGYARWSGYWHANVPSDTYFELVPRANEYGHP